MSRASGSNPLYHKTLPECVYRIETQLFSKTQKKYSHVFNVFIWPHVVFQRHLIQLQKILCYVKRKLQLMHIFTCILASIVQLTETNEFNVKLKLSHSISELEFSRKIFTFIFNLISTSCTSEIKVSSHVSTVA